MPDLYTYVSRKVSDDDVPAAIEAAKEKAMEKLGGKDVVLVASSWTRDYVCTKWLRAVPDVPNQG
jgi:hypothetical protein